MNFNIASIVRIAKGMKLAIKRFSLAMLSASIGTVIGIILLHAEEPLFYPNMLLTLALAFPLFIAIVLFEEQKSWSSRAKVIANSVAVACLIIYYSLLPKNIFWAEQMFIIRYIMWAVGFILLVTFVPFLKKNKERATILFWQYNRILFFSIALTVLWAMTIYVGLSIAMASIDFLFNINIDTERYMELWIIVAGLFGTTFFLSRIPKNTQDTRDIETYPKELRLFSQYVLVPLVAIYFLILYAYVVKIFIIWEWPEGVLAYMILGFSFLGVLTYISLYPLRDKYLWVRKAGNIFYIVLIPQIGMLFWALWLRISQYAITENRYFVFVFGLWLLGITIYFLISKRKDIRIIPVTIFAIAFISSFGPWGAFTISEKSQCNRLEKLLIENNLLIDGTIRKSTEEVSSKDKKEISAIIRYLNRVHGFDSIQPWFNESLTVLESEEEDQQSIYDRRTYNSYILPKKIVEGLIGVDYIEQWEMSDSKDQYFYLYVDYLQSEQLLDISQYDYMVMFNNIPIPGMSPKNNIVTINNDIYRFKIENDNDFIVFKNDNIIAKISLKNFLEECLKQESREPLDRDDMKIEFSNENISFALYFDNINGERKENNIYKIQSVGAKLLFSLKQ